MKKIFSLIIIVGLISPSCNLLWAWPKAPEGCDFLLFAAAARLEAQLDQMDARDNQKILAHQTQLEQRRTAQGLLPFSLSSDSLNALPELSSQDVELKITGIYETARLFNLHGKVEILQPGYVAVLVDGRLVAYQTEQGQLKPIPAY